MTAVRFIKPNDRFEIRHRRQAHVDSRLHVFLAVARTGQLTRASRQLNLSASAVSTQIMALERDLRATLFIRSSRGMTLTPSGKLMFTTAEQMEAVWTRTAREIQAEEQGAARLNIAASHTAAELFLPQPLGRFRAKWPDTRLHLVITNSQMVADRVTTGQADLGIIEGSRSPEELSSEALWTDELILVVSTRHPWASQGSVDASHLPQADWILREEGSGTRRVFNDALTHAGFSESDLSVMMELDSLRAIIAMVANNVGVSVMSRETVDSEEIRVRGVAALSIRGLNLTRQLKAIFPISHQAPRTGHLLADLREDVLIRRQRVRQDS